MEQNIKIATMAEKILNLEKTNSSEHKVIFEALKENNDKLDAIKTAMETKKVTDIETFVRQRDFNDLAIKVGKHDRFFWMALAIVSFITLLLNLFGKQIISKL